jgi:cyanophycinase
MANSRRRKKTSSTPSSKTTTPPHPAPNAKGGVKGAPRGKLLLIGGREDKLNERRILRTLVEQMGAGKLFVVTLASEYGEECWTDYRQVFSKLGAVDIDHLIIERGDDAEQGHQREQLQEVAAVFFTGGDQVRITTRLGGTRLDRELDEFFFRGGIIAGTSAGASALGEMMLVGGRHEGWHKVGDAFQMVPGLGFMRDVIIDQHFSERGRIRRLLGAVAQNPRMLGIGIDEDTAVLVEGAERFEVLGSGAVYVVDGHGVTYTNSAEQAPDKTLSVFGVKLHVLSHGDGFNLTTNQPEKKFETDK